MKLTGDFDFKFSYSYETKVLTIQIGDSKENSLDVKNIEDIEDVMDEVGSVLSIYEDTNDFVRVTEEEMRAKEKEEEHKTRINNVKKEFGIEEEQK